MHEKGDMAVISFLAFGQACGFVDLTPPATNGVCNGAIRTPWVSSCTLNLTTAMKDG
jgi:hypothetical protein